MRNSMPALVFLSAIFFAANTFIFFGGLDPTKFNVPKETPYITPAVYTFGIWAVIYLWLIIATFIQWRKHARDGNWSELRLPLMFSMLVGSTWVYTLAGSAFISTIVIILMWLGAFFAVIKTPKRSLWIGIYPEGLYLGWLSAATGVSLGTWLFEIGMSNMLSSVLGLVVAALLAVIVTFGAPVAITASLATVWGLIGIIVNNLGSDGQIWVLALSGICAAALILIGFRNWKGEIGR